MKITEPGIYTDFDAAAYHQDPCPAPSLNQSTAKILIEKSPKHAWVQHPRLGGQADEDGTEQAPKAQQAIGQAAHKMVIGRGRDVAVLPYANWRKGDAQDARDRALAAGQIPLTEPQGDAAHGLARVFREQMEAICPHAFTTGSGEVVIAWQEDGLWFRSMIDWVCSTTLLYDLKTSTVSISPQAIPMKMVTDGWDVQAAFQERGLDILDPENRGRRKFRFVAVEQSDPFALVCAELPESVLTMGRKKVQYAVDVWRRCMERDEWPAYPAEIIRPSYPEFKERQWLDREVEEAERRGPYAATPFNTTGIIAG